MHSLDVHIHTNSSCNLKCIHCYEGDDKACNQSISEEFEISLINFLCENYDTDIHLEGGEIFLAENLIRALKSVERKYRKHIVITSNGMFCSQNPETLNVLKSIHCLRISVEGHNDDLHKTIRGCNVNEVLKNSAYYRDMDINVVLRITLNRLNMDKMFSQVIPSLMEKGFEQFQIYEMQPVGSAEYSNICIDGSLDTFFRDWINNPVTGSVKVSFSSKRKKEIEQYSDELKGNGFSIKEAGNEASISIGADGAVRICAWDMVSKPLMYLDHSGNFSDLCDIIDNQKTPHTCNYCTRYIICQSAPFFGKKTACGNKAF